MYIKKKDYKDRIINSLNNKRYFELSQHFKGFISYIYPNIKDDDLIICNKKKGSKIDFQIEVNQVCKNVSVKNGDIIYVYKDRIMNLVLFLLSIKVSKECIMAMLYYHYGDGTIDGSGSSINSFSGLLCEDYKKEIEIVNNEFKNKELLGKVIDYLLINEKSGNKVDYFYYGDERSASYANSSIVRENIINEDNNYPHKFMRIGVMNFHPLKRSYSYLDSNLSYKHICVLKLNLGKYIKK